MPPTGWSPTPQAERADLVSLYDADPDLVDVVLPGVDLDAFHDRDRAAARAALGYRPDELVVLFVGRIQPLKAPDLLVRAMSRLARGGSRPWPPGCAWSSAAGPSGSGTEHPTALADLAAELHVPAAFHAPTDRARLRAALRGRRRGGRPVALRVVRPGRRRGAGVRDPGAGRQRRGPAGGGARRGLRAPGGRPRARTCGPRPCAGSWPTTPCAHAWRAGRAGTPRTLSWDATVDGLLTSYAAALAARATPWAGSADAPADHGRQPAGRAARGRGPGARASRAAPVRDRAARSGEAAHHGQHGRGPAGADDQRVRRPPPRRERRGGLPLAAAAEHPACWAWPSPWTASGTSTWPVGSRSRDSARRTSTGCSARCCARPTSRSTPSCGWASPRAIRRERAWRESRGESTANLEAFADLGPSRTAG